MGDGESITNMIPADMDVNSVIATMDVHQNPSSHTVVYHISSSSRNQLIAGASFSAAFGLGGTCAVCTGECNVFSWRYRCAQCGFDIHIDYVPIRCDKKTTTDQGIPTYVPPSLLFLPQSYLGGYDYGIPHSHPLNMNHNYMPRAQSQLQPRPQPHQQHQIHEIPYWHPSTSPYFPSPLNMNPNNMPQPKTQLQHQNYRNPWHPSTSSPCFPS
ncbi:hypothetical protein BC332_32754 [Capsicum chinense]|nr:hypothetical protein BC332_32754 [Capsicum chinense]